MSKKTKIKQKTSVGAILGLIFFGVLIGVILAKVVIGIGENREFEKGSAQIKVGEPPSQGQVQVEPTKQSVEPAPVQNDLLKSYPISSTCGAKCEYDLAIGKTPPTSSMVEISEDKKSVQAKVYLENRGIKKVTNIRWKITNETLNQILAEGSIGSLDSKKGILVYDQKIDRAADGSAIYFTVSNPYKYAITIMKFDQEDSDSNRGNNTYYFTIMK